VSVSQLTIKKICEDHFEFYYTTNEDVEELHRERSDVVKFLDESIDVLMLMNQRMTNTMISGPYNKIVIKAGNCGAD
jgi:hypothetical protein